MFITVPRGQIADGRVFLEKIFFDCWINPMVITIATEGKNKAKELLSLTFCKVILSKIEQKNLCNDLLDFSVFFPAKAIRQPFLQKVLQRQKIPKISRRGANWKFFLGRPFRIRNVRGQATVQSYRSFGKTFSVSVLVFLARYGSARDKNWEWFTAISFGNDPLLRVVLPKDVIQFPTFSSNLLFHAFFSSLNLISQSRKHLQTTANTIGSTAYIPRLKYAMFSTCF